MKKLVLLTIVVLAVAALPVLAEPTSTAAPDPAPATDRCAVASPGDLATLSGAALDLRLKELGLQIADAVPAQPPLCPTATSCATGCTPGTMCALSILGPCCTTASGLHLCCLPPKNIVVKVCPCRGTGCTGSQLTWGCQ